MTTKKAKKSMEHTCLWGSLRELAPHVLITGCYLLVNSLQHSSITINLIVNILVSTNSDSRLLMVGSSLVPFGRGGIGALHWETHTKAMRAHWIFRYLDPTQGNWKILPDNWV